MIILTAVLPEYRGKPEVVTSFETLNIFTLLRSKFLFYNNFFKINMLWFCYQKYKTTEQYDINFFAIDVRYKVY